jgi:hypothetical protein
LGRSVSSPTSAFPLPGTFASTLAAAKGGLRNRDRIDLIREVGE